MAWPLSYGDCCALSYGARRPPVQPPRAPGRPPRPLVRGPRRQGRRRTCGHAGRGRRTRGPRPGPAGPLPPVRVYRDLRHFRVDLRHVRVDYELRGRPVDRGQLLDVATAFLRGRKPDIPDHSVCFACKRRGTVRVTVAHGTPASVPARHRLRSHRGPPRPALPPLHPGLRRHPHRRPARPADRPEPGRHRARPAPSRPGRARRPGVSRRRRRAHPAVRAGRTPPRPVHLLRRPLPATDRDAHLAGAPRPVRRRDAPTATAAGRRAARTCRQACSRQSAVRLPPPSGADDVPAEGPA